LRRYLLGALVCALIACSPAREETTTITTETTETIAATDTTVTTDTAATTATSGTTTTAATATSAAKPATQEKPMSQSQIKVAEIKTTAGDIHIRFFPDVAPNHVKNFIDLAQKGFYNNTKFHRVIPGFMIQGGDPNTVSGDPGSWGTGGSPTKLKAEFNSIPHRRGIVSMARSNDPNSASSQFFIVVADSTFLDNNYTVFGQVTKGMDVADKIVSAPRGAADRPNSPTSIQSITIRDAKPEESGPAPK
jgi:cyclophilin family peptidyl-prolyl cis-trans isomerase